MPYMVFKEINLFGKSYKNNKLIDLQKFDSNKKDLLFLAFDSCGFKMAEI